MNHMLAVICAKAGLWNLENLQVALKPVFTRA